MGEQTKIQWCDHTASPWHGCSKVSAGCTNCYAAAGAKRNPGVLGIWGDEGTRVKSKSFIKNLLQWQKQAEQEGLRRVTVFPSLCDPFEDRAELGPWRREMFTAIDECPNVTLILVTKRPENIRRMWSGICHDRDLGGNGVTMSLYRSNVFLLTSVENQEAANERIPHLLECRDLCPVLGLSCEPLLGELDLSEWLSINIDVVPDIYGHPHEIKWPHNWIRWCLIGGESGPNARPCNVAWIRSLVNQCRAAKTPCFVKQLGSMAYSISGNDSRYISVKDIRWARRECGNSSFATNKPDPPGTYHSPLVYSDPKGGNIDEFPEDLRVREFPEVMGEIPV